MIETENINFYHGTKIPGLSILKSIDDLRESGIEYQIGSTDGDRVFFTDKVFVTTDKNLARQYAGKDGIVYNVEPVNPVLYCDLFAHRVQTGKITKKSKKVLAKKVKKLAKNLTVFVCDKAVILNKGE